MHQSSEQRLKSVHTASYRIGIDLSIIDRLKTGTSVYIKNLFHALNDLNEPDMEFVPLRAPKPLPRKNILTKFGNFFLEIFWLLVILPLKVKKQKINLLHLPANAISPFVKVPQVCSIHDAHFITNPTGRDPLWRLYAKWHFRYAAKNADKILCDSNSAKKEIVRILGARPDNIEVIYLGLPERSSESPDRDKADKYVPFILSVGAIDPNKNFLSLVKAYAQLAKNGQTAGHKLIIAGPPGRDQPLLEEEMHKNALENQVKLLGWVSDSMLAALYEKASLFVFPSLCEGFGFPPLEAMHKGVPVAASKAPCIPETLGEAAIYFDPSNISEIAEKMNMLLSDQLLRKELVSAGLARADGFTWHKTAVKTATVYRSLLE